MLTRDKDSHGSHLHDDGKGGDHPTTWSPARWKAEREAKEDASQGAERVAKCRNCGREDIDRGDGQTLFKSLRDDGILAELRPHDLCVDCTAVATYFTNRGLAAFKSHLSVDKAAGPLVGKSPSQRRASLRNILKSGFKIGAA